MPERPDAVEQALRALRSRDRSTAELDARLERRGVGAAERAGALELLERVGYLDDDRYARSRAQQLADRGSGDALIRYDLEGRGVAAEFVEAALAALEPEQQRVARIVERRGRTATTARYLAARGFDTDVLGSVIAQEE